jgi:hypothetical protein
MAFREFPAHCGPLFHPAYKDSPAGPSPAEIGNDPFFQAIGQSVLLMPGAKKSGVP